MRVEMPELVSLSFVSCSFLSTYLPHVDYHTGRSIPSEDAYGSHIVQPRSSSVCVGFELSSQHRGGTIRSGWEPYRLNVYEGSVLGLDIVSGVWSESALRVRKAPIRAEIEDFALQDVSDMTS